MQTTEALVLRKTAYGDKRVIVNVYTPDQGPLGLIASLSKKSTKGLKPAHFQALQTLEIVYRENSKGDLKGLSEARILEPYQDLYFDPTKACVALFLAELLQKVLHEQEPNPELFEFLKMAIKDLDKQESGIANYHLFFMLKLSAHLGFSPHLEDGDYFDLMQGDVSWKVPHHPYFIANEELALWRAIDDWEWSEWPSFQLRNGNLRRQALDNMIQYYRLHLHDFGTLKSLSVLREVLA